MPVMNVNLLLDDATYAGVKSGALQLCGMVKDSDHKIRKHLPTVFDAAKDGASKAIDIVREHKKGALVLGGVIIVGGAVVGTVGYFTSKDKRKAEKKLGQSFDAYLEAAKDGTLTIEILDTLIEDLDEVKKYRKDDAIPLNLTAKQLTTLFNSIYDFTKRMAEANNVHVDELKAPRFFKKNTVVDLRNYLDIQKSIIEKAA